jgi:crotonobetainyl-CoA:carnitine CoA-transferase CaiB-like acyl-CoA transferase
VTGAQAAVRLPLRGVRVLDFTHVWSGPMATRVLAGLGAEVLKVEGPQRPDPQRGAAAGILSRFPGREPGADPENRNAWFNTHNTDKTSVVIDVKHPDGRRLVHGLAARCDVFIANFRPGVLERLGLGYRTLQSLRDDLVYVEMPGYGTEGPLATMQAFGAQFEATSGAGWLMGDDHEPRLTGFPVADPTAGLTAASAVLCALQQRRRTGAGCRIEVAQRDAMLPLLGEHFLASSLGLPVERRLNAGRGTAPHGIYRTADGGWLALAAHSADQWDALADVLGVAATDAAARFRGIDDRLAAVDAIDRLVASWVQAHSHPASLAERLQERGVPAAPVNDGAALYRDPHLRANGYFAALEHPSVGRHDYPALPYRYGGRRIAPRRAAPRLDEHTDEVLERLLGLSTAELRRLRADGVIGSRLREGPPDRSSTRTEEET